MSSLCDIRIFENQTYIPTLTANHATIAGWGEIVTQH